MRWKKKCEFEGIFDLVYYDYRNIIEQGYFIYYDEHNFLHVVSTETLEEVYSKEQADSGRFILYPNELYIEEAGTVKVLSLKDFGEKRLCTTSLERCLPLNKLYSLGSSYSRKTQMNSTELISNETGKKIWEKNGPEGFSDFIDETLLFSNSERTVLSRIELQTGNEKWRRELIQGRLWHKQQPLLVNDILIIPHNENMLIGINVNTGERYWEIENSFFSYQVDPVTSLLHSIDKQTYHVIDPVNGKKIVEVTIPELADDVWKGANSKLCTICGDGFYFSNNNEGIQVGKINTSTYQLEYYETLSKEKVENVYAPNFYKDQMFLIADDSLYVFDRTQ